MVRSQGSVTGVNVVSPQAPGGLGLCAHGHQVINIHHFAGAFSHLQKNSGNMHQILSSRYFREELQQRMWEKGAVGQTYTYFKSNTILIHFVFLIFF